MLLSTNDVLLAERGSWEEEEGMECRKGVESLRRVLSINGGLLRGIWAPLARWDVMDIKGGLSQGRLLLS